jgi:hypothetical protein
MSLVLQSSGGGSVTLEEPVTASNFTITVPAVSGTMLTNTTNIVSGTAVASTSGTAIDFTGIPSWVKRITVMFNGVSTNGTSEKLVKISDSSTYPTTGFNSLSTRLENAAAVVGKISSAGFVIASYTAADAVYGSLIITNISGNIWAASGCFNANGGANIGIPTSGSGSISGTLDRVRITTVNGTDAFDAGSINILYE